MVETVQRIHCVCAHGSVASMQVQHFFNEIFIGNTSSGILCQLRDLYSPYAVAGKFTIGNLKSSLSSLKENAMVLAS
jgi:hypothetical protein